MQVFGKIVFNKILKDEEIYEVEKIFADSYLESDPTYDVRKKTVTINNYPCKDETTLMDGLKFMLDCLNVISGTRVRTMKLYIYKSYGQEKNMPDYEISFGDNCIQLVRNEYDDGFCIMRNPEREDIVY